MREGRSGIVQFGRQFHARGAGANDRHAHEGGGGGLIAEGARDTQAVVEQPVPKAIGLRAIIQEQTVFARPGRAVVVGDRTGRDGQIIVADAMWADEFATFLDEWRNRHKAGIAIDSVHAPQEEAVVPAMAVSAVADFVEIGIERPRRHFVQERFPYVRAIALYQNNVMMRSAVVEPEPTHELQAACAATDYDDLGFLHCGYADSMALSATVYIFTVRLADADRGVYETLELRLARHPSETEEYLLTRLLAYCLEYTEGIVFSKGLSNPDEPAIAVYDLTGVLQTWIDIGAPEAPRLHKAAKAARRVAVYAHRDTEAWLGRMAGERIHRAEEIAIYRMDGALLQALTLRLERRMALDLAVSDGVIYMTLGGETVTGSVAVRALVEARAPA